MRSAFDHQRGGKFLNFILTFFKKRGHPLQTSNIKIAKKK